MNRFYQPEISAGQLWLSPEESKHAVRVMRMSVGDSLHLTDGKGAFYDASISIADPSRCEFTINSKYPVIRKPFAIHIAIAPTKNTDRMEWFVEKAVEIGVDRITFLHCENSERKVLKLDRLEKLAISAMKQSGQAWLTEIFPIVHFREFISAQKGQNFIAFVGAATAHHLQAVARPGQDALVLIGPEGDFSSAEVKEAIDYGFKQVSLGANRLRTETAGIAACHILNLINS